MRVARARRDGAGTASASAAALAAARNCAAHSQMHACACGAALPGASCLPAASAGQA
eukprot:CAMPEP_0119161502 /NCGR_PEP_ID=MMETSP1315-20130426/1410_1 /TAXON_ID=676789 /ORGANISM="Prasinoderma singularis, Strain RCC927" /LENGTH=56 /DNA_ID=CAMNT_0007154249 /DNA_START=101 /DNA_END=267 /DNA_ORIENTATION=+